MSRSAGLLLAILAAIVMAFAMAMHGEVDPLERGPQGRDPTAAASGGDEPGEGGPAAVVRTAVGGDEPIAMTAILPMDLAQGIHLVGRAVDDTAAAAAGVAVSLQAAVDAGWLGDVAPLPAVLGATTTDAHGRFEVRGAHADGYRLILERARQPAISFEVPGPREPGERRDLGSLVLHASLGLVVLVERVDVERVLVERVDPERREPAGPVEGARVVASPVLFDPFLGGATPRRTAVSDATGAAVIYGLPPGDWTIRVEAEGLATTEVAHHQRSDATLTTTLRVALQRGHSLGGRVLGPAGEAIAGAQLTLTPEGRSPVSTVIQSGAGGEFRAVGLPEGRVAVLAEALAWERVVLSGVSLPTAERLELRFTGGLGLMGQVVDARDGAPLQGVRVQATRSDREPLVRAGRLVRPSAVTDAGGSFRVDGLPRGRFDLEFRSMRHARLIVKALEPAPLPGASTSFRLEPAPEVEVTVRDPSGRPLPGAEVEMLPAEHDGTALKELLLRATGAAERVVVRTDRDGRAILPAALPAFRLLARAAQHPTQLGPVLGVEAAQARLVAPDLRFGRGGTIAGRCVDAAGQAVPDLVLRAEPSGPPPTRMFEEIRADALGRYRFGPLAAGTWIVTAVPGGSAARAPAATLIVVDGETLSHEVQLR